MGKDWDGDKGGRQGWIQWMSEVMRECHRVLKPGAHGLVWALPRTSHWTATALEDAGFEIRDVVTHLFGQGFPKSLDVSKAMDKAAGAERTSTGQLMAGHSEGRKRTFGTNGDIYGNAIDSKAYVTAPSTDAAKQWQGWGTALKPASEHWILVRKPCSEKTVAANVLKWGCGAINIDGSRIESSDADQLAKNWDRAQSVGAKGNASGAMRLKAIDLRDRTPTGRFPANLVLDEEASPLLGESSRFFYCAKISPSERGDTNTHPTVKPQKLMRYFIKMVTPPKGTVLDPFMGSGSTGLAAKNDGFQFIGIEKDDGYFSIAQKRIEGRA